MVFLVFLQAGTALVELSADPDVDTGSSLLAAALLFGLAS